MLASVSRRFHPVHGLCHLQSSWKKHVRLESTVSYLRNSKNGAELYMIGTAHVSAKSADEVQEVIQRVKPNVVMVELCAERERSVRLGHQPKSMLQIFQDVVRTSFGIEGKAFLFGMRALYKVVGDMGLEPGTDMKTAMDEADRVGARLLLGDQKSSVTVKRVSQAMPLYKLPNLLMWLVKNADGKDVPPVVSQLAASNMSDLGSAIEGIKDRESVRQLMAFVEDRCPDLVQALIHERDAHMVEQLRKCEGTIVGVVGLAHMDGIERRWKLAEGD